MTLKLSSQHTHTLIATNIHVCGREYCCTWSFDNDNFSQVFKSENSILCQLHIFPTNLICHSCEKAIKVFYEPPIPVTLGILNSRYSSRVTAVCTNERIEKKLRVTLVILVRNAGYFQSYL